MSDNTTRHGSLQFYPRVRAKRLLPRVNWSFLCDMSREEKGLIGAIGYKVGMMSAYVRDNTPNSMTKGQRIIIPVTIIECPLMKILSVRFYKNKKVNIEVLNDNLDKELKRELKLPKKEKNAKVLIEEIEKKANFDDIRVVVYSQAKKTGIKKTPDIIEMGLSGNLNEKLEFIRANLAKDMSVKDIFKDQVVDIRGVTKGKGTQGTVKRFGLTLKQHKSEKGQRTLGSGGPWHPSRVEFNQPRMGQMGYFTRVNYNNKIIEIKNINEKDINPKEGFKHFGKIRNDYVIVRGSVQGPTKRQLLITAPIRETNKHTKKTYELIELR